MSVATNPLSYNAFIEQIATLAVVNFQNLGGVNQFVDPPLQNATPQMLNYAELRIQRDLDLLNSQSSNNYTLTAGQSVFPLPVDDFVTIQTVEITQNNGPDVVTSVPLIAVSKEMIQNCYSGLGNAGQPMYYAMYGDTFGSNQDSNMNILFGPPPNYPYTLRITGTCREPSLYKSAVTGTADTAYTYISAYYPDMLVMAAMVYMSAYQRNFSATSDDSQMPMTYEKQYQILRLGAVAEENRRKSQGSGWTAYSTPTAATAER